SCGITVCFSWVFWGFMPFWRYLFSGVKCFVVLFKDMPPPFDKHINNQKHPPQTNINKPHPMDYNHLCIRGVKTYIG
ncbi:MAG: hypothetical protein QXF45_08275, partial [Candidatus Caldarchaeum sp.]